jgi:hypothetical protein
MTATTIVLDAKKFDDTDDKAAEEWLEARYGERVAAAMVGMTKLAESCATDQRFQAASEEFGRAMAM